eukprot:1641453-Amphidinium_carterae.2
MFINGFCLVALNKLRRTAEQAQAEHTQLAAGCTSDAGSAGRELMESEADVSWAQGQVVVL